MSLKKILFGSFFTFVSVLLFSTKAYAAVDISLEDNIEEKTLSIMIESNESYVDGADFGVIYSDDVTVTEVSITEGLCTFGGNATFENNRISIECLNDSDTEMSGVLATIKYETELEDYSFYLDESYIDLGSLTLGEVVNVNKPENIIVEDNTATVDEVVTEESTLDKGITLLSENPLYVLAGVITLIAIVIGVVGLTSKEEEA